MVSAELPGREIIEEYTASTGALRDFFERNSECISHIYHNAERLFSLRHKPLPWVCFSGRSEEEKAINSSLFWELVQATHEDDRNLVVEVGPAHSISPLQTAAFLKQTTVIGMDYEIQPMRYYDRILPNEIPSPSSGSFVASFQLHSSHLGNTQSVEAHRVQLIAHANRALSSTVPEVAEMVKVGGDLVVVCESDLTDQHPLAIIEEMARGWLWGFDVEVASLSLVEIKSRFGFSASSHIQVSGLDDPTPVSVIQAVRVE